MFVLGQKPSTENTKFVPCCFWLDHTCLVHLPNKTFCLSVCDGKAACVRARSRGEKFSLLSIWYLLKNASGVCAYFGSLLAASSLFTSISAFWLGPNTVESAEIHLKESSKLGDPRSNWQIKLLDCYMREPWQSSAQQCQKNFMHELVQVSWRLRSQREWNTFPWKHPSCFWKFSHARMWNLEYQT